MIVKKHFIKNVYKVKHFIVHDKTWEVVGWYFLGVIPLYITKTLVKGNY